MKNKQLKFKSKHKLTLSILSMLLLVCIVSTSVFAAEGGEKVEYAGVTTIGSSYNGDGVAGQSYSTIDPENIWGTMTRDSTGTYQASYGFMGYRMYVVDGAGNLQSKVIDLLYSILDTLNTLKVLFFCLNSDNW